MFPPKHADLDTGIAAAASVSVFNIDEVRLFCGGFDCRKLFHEYILTENSSLSLMEQT